MFCFFQLRPGHSLQVQFQYVLCNDVVLSYFNWFFNNKTISFHFIFFLQKYNLVIGSVMLNLFIWVLTSLSTLYRSYHDW